MKVEEKVQARELRKAGKSIKSIAQQIGVAKSSVSVWTRDIKLTKAQQEILKQNSCHAQYLASQKSIETWCQRRLKYQQEGRVKAQEGELLHNQGCMLYWGEGTKSTAALKFSNSDPQMMTVFCKFTQRYFAEESHRARLSLYLYPDHKAKEQETIDFWLQTCGQEMAAMYVTYVESTATKNKRTNFLPYGTAHFQIGSVKMLQHIYGAIGEYADFDPSFWASK